MRFNRAIVLRQREVNLAQKQEVQGRIFEQVCAPSGQDDQAHKGLQSSEGSEAPYHIGVPRSFGVRLLVLARPVVLRRLCADAAHS